ncbi:ribose-5-phosphate isomerase [Candidatus Woesearchaeota archaeon CG10_big_fil_rev_8_21_14_0_10_37_12]|nr:MAG: ribose-5-phosphate isomerase [Candidatus Woesearchaeota archaeon CG10_big_fil_rev_8_21_14_0_10_37_12]
MEQTVYVGADHAGYALKENIKLFLQKKGYSIKDQGAHKLSLGDDYPDYAKKVAQIVQKETNSFGILFCGSAEGVCIAANKFKGIRAIAVRTPLLAKMSRKHENANVLCLAGGATKQKVKGLGLSKTQAEKITHAFLTTSFSGEERHKRRLQKISRLEK